MRNRLADAGMASVEAPCAGTIPRGQGNRRSPHLFEPTRVISPLRVLLQIRRHTGISQRELARRTGVAVQTIRNWEHGRADPHASLWIAALNVLGYEVHVTRREQE